MIQVDIVVPSPIQIQVQFLKGTNLVTTKKKVLVDKKTKVAKFNEKISLVTTLTKDARNVFTDKQVHLKLMAHYNNKEKAIGIANLNLA